MKLKVVLEPSQDGGYTVTVPSLPGCISEGDTRDEALRNIREAIELYLDPVEDDASFGPDAEQARDSGMSKVPALSYTEVIRALRRNGWVVVRQRGSHIRLHKHTPTGDPQARGPCPSADQAVNAVAHTQAGALSLKEFQELL